MCHNSCHIWICHRRNNSAPGNISVRGEIQVRGSVFLWARMCVYVSVRACQPPHTLAVKWKKSSAALFCHFSLSVLFSLSLSFTVHILTANPAVCSLTQLPWSQWSCGFCLLHFGAAIYSVGEEFDKLAGWWLMGKPPWSSTHPADKTDLHPDPRLRAF